MKINWYKSESTVVPKEIDYESSPTTIYIHKNIDNEDRDGVTWYTYEEAKLTPTEYQIYAAEQTRKDNLEIMNKLADLYAQINK